MSAIRIRLRHPSGTSTLSLAAAFTLKIGFPPQALDLDQFASDVCLNDTNLDLNGQQVIVEQKDIAAALSQPLGSSAPAPAPPEILSPPSDTPAKTARSRRNSRNAENVAQNPPEIALPSHSATLVLRVMPDDNSCLFRALSAAALGTGPAASGDDGTADSMYELRSLVAGTIASQPDTYSAAILDKEPAKYCEWIQSPKSWGGAIELGILATHFGLEVASINVQDGRVDRFNEGAEQRIILVYSGIHYDVAALSPSEPPHTRADLMGELDVRVFDSGDAEVLTAAQELCSELRKAHYFTDTAGFGVACNVAGCGWKGIGEKEAVGHAKATGHYDFGEA